MEFVKQIWLKNTVLQTVGYSWLIRPGYVTLLMQT